MSDTDARLEQLARIEGKQDRILAILNARAGAANGIYGYNLNADQPTIECPPRDDDAEVAAALRRGWTGEPLRLRKVPGGWVSVADQQK